MATVPVTRSDQLVDIAVYTWPNLTTTNADGAPVSFQGSGDRTVQFNGTFGVGGSIQFEGSNDGNTWFVLTDPQGNNIVKTSAAMEIIEEGPVFVRPKITAGDGSTQLTAVLVVRRK